MPKAKNTEENQVAQPADSPQADVVEQASLQNTIPENLDDPKYFFNRELSWLEFNYRVLHESFDDRNPLIERLKFSAIFSSNLDEFFMVRVAGIKQQVEAGVVKLTPDGRTPAQQLADIRPRLHPWVIEQHHFFQQELRSRMAQAGIYLLDYIDLSQEQRQYLQQYFEEQVFPVLTPLAVDPGHPFPYISNLSLNLAVVVSEPDTEQEHFARVKVPKLLPRFVSLPNHLQHHQDGITTRWTGVPLEQVIAHNLQMLFPGMKIQEYHPFRVTRNADLEIQEDEADDLLAAMEQELRKRRVGGQVVRLELQNAMPDNIRETLMREMRIEENDVYELEGLLALGDLMSFLRLPAPDLKDPPWMPVVHPRLKQTWERESTSTGIELEESREDIFCEIRDRGDILVHHPYQSFIASVQHFITSAAHNPDVLAIKMTLYRTSGDSPIVQALIEAAENGKQVAALVELKARFDEENNIQWARALEKAGVHVVYGLVGLKTHTKLALVVRREGEKIRRYMHIGTGNYNPKTAGLYTDLGLFTCREDLGADVTDLFNHLTGYSRQQHYRKLLVAPVNMRDRFLSMIQRETEHCRNGREGRIVAKMNSLVDPPIITALYEASQAGVNIDLVVRGICCLRPGIPGISDRIRVVSVVGRLLEHSRIFYFQNNGNEEVFIGSADWMPRNLTRRVESVTPVEHPELTKELQEILGIMLSDNRHAWELQSDGSYAQRHPGESERERSAQKILMEIAMESGTAS